MSPALVEGALPTVVEDLVSMLRGRRVRKCRVHRRAPVHVFTDGAAEEGMPAKAGAVLIDPESGLELSFNGRRITVLKQF